MKRLRFRTVIRLWLEVPYRELPAEFGALAHWGSFILTLWLNPGRPVARGDPNYPTYQAPSATSPSNGFTMLLTKISMAAEIRPLYRYVQCTLLLSRTLLEVLGCFYYLFWCDFNDSARGSTYRTFFRTMLVKKKHYCTKFTSRRWKHSEDLPVRAQLR